MRLSRRVSGLQASLTRRLFDLAQRYDDVVDLTLGDPDLFPPSSLRRAACEAIRRGRTRYSQNAGLMAARKAVAEFNTGFYGKKISPEEVILTCGGMEALYLTLAALVDTGDEVIIPAPYWVNYGHMTMLCGGKPVFVPTRPEDDFAISVEELERAITKRTRVLILNSPNNPTGRMIPGRALDEIARMAVRHDLFVISDEVYRSLVYDGARHESIWTRPGMRRRCVIIDSMSKRFSMTGYRLGMAIAPKELVLVLSRLQENVAACAPLPSQYAAIAGYDLKTDASHLLREFAKRRRVLLDGLAGIHGLSIGAVDGTFYAFVNISATGLNSYDFATRLLERQHVAVVPGRTYGRQYDDYVRIAFTVSVARIKIALTRISCFLEQCRRKGGRR